MAITCSPSPSSPPKPHRLRHRHRYHPASLASPPLHAPPPARRSRPTDATNAPCGHVGRYSPRPLSVVGLSPRPRCHYALATRGPRPLPPLSHRPRYCVKIVFTYAVTHSHLSFPHTKRSQHPVCRETETHPPPRSEMRKATCTRLATHTVAVTACAGC